jgi:plastocyanin
MSLPRPTAAIALVAALAVAGCGGSSSDGEGTTSAAKAPTAAAPTNPAAAGPAVASATIDIKSFKYKPVVVTVKKGGRIRWTNSDAAAHTATADDRSFDTQTIDKGKSRTVTVTSAGSFAYHCDFHPFMKATVVVR